MRRHYFGVIGKINRKQPKNIPLHKNIKEIIERFHAERQVQNENKQNTYRRKPFQRIA